MNYEQMQEELEQFKYELIRGGEDALTPSCMSERALAGLLLLNELQPNFIIEIASVMQTLRNIPDTVELSENETQQLADIYMLHIEREVRRRESSEMKAASFEDLFDRSTIESTLTS